MHYYVDGYNLMFRVLHAGEDLTAQRNRVIEELNEKVKFLELDVTLVFDAHHQVGEGSRFYANYMKIVFTNERETADEFILHELKHEPTPRMHTVVTSDNKLAWLARIKLAKTETVEHFFNWIQKRYRNKQRRLKEEESAVVLKKAAAEKPKEKEPPSPKKKIPSLTASAEDCLDYYQSIFESEFKQSPISESNPLKETKPIIDQPKPKKKKPPKEEAISDYERWLDAFENNKGQDKTGFNV